MFAMFCFANAWHVEHQSRLPATVYSSSTMCVAVQSWNSQVKAYTPPVDGMFSKILVPTVDVVRSTWLLSTTVGAGRPCLFVGESGTAKTATIQHYLGTWTANNNIVLNMNFSSRTSSLDVQRAIEVNLEHTHIVLLALTTLSRDKWHQSFH